MPGEINDPKPPEKELLSWFENTDTSELVEDHLGKVTSAIPLGGGLVHHVYRIKGNKGTAILKARDDHYVALPHIPADPHDINYERKAISLLSEMEPEVFPRLLGFDEGNQAILMTDIMSGGINLRTLLDEEGITEKMASLLGKTIARTHNKLRLINEPIREDDDMECYQKNLYYRLGYQDHHRLNVLIDTLSMRPRQLILGDLSPKNIAIVSDSKITICDLDLVHMGNPEFDVGFLIGHVLAHNLIRPTQSLHLTEAVLSGYFSEKKRGEIEELMIKQIALGTVIYRLQNPVIPYSLPLSEDLRRSKANVAFDLLNYSDISWQDVTGKFADEQRNNRQW